MVITIHLINNICSCSFSRTLHNANIIWLIAFWSLITYTAHLCLNGSCLKIKLIHSLGMYVFLVIQFFFSYSSQFNHVHVICLTLKMKDYFSNLVYHFTSKLVFYFYCVVPHNIHTSPHRKEKPPLVWKFQLNSIHFLKFLGVGSTHTTPSPPGMSIPNCGGSMDISWNFTSLFLLLQIIFVIFVYPVREMSISFPLKYV